MMNYGEIIATCLGISKRHFLNIPYKGMSIVDLYGIDGIENKATSVCHYCTINTLESILKNNSLRFTDVRFLNDSTEFIEIIPLVKDVINRGSYDKKFKDMLLDQSIMNEMSNYLQSANTYSIRNEGYSTILYKTYTCSFSTDNDSLSMWNYYANSANGISVVFDHAWNMFEGSDKTALNTVDKLSNDIIIYRGIIIYDDATKKQCISELVNSLYNVYNDIKDDIDKYYNYLIYAFKEAINNMRCFFKNSHFKDECEYRVALKIPEEILQTEEKVDNIIQKGFFNRGNILIPYVDYRLNTKSMELIVTNPFNSENPLFKLSIENLLCSMKMEKVEIYSSSVPIRRYN